MQMYLNTNAVKYVCAIQCNKIQMKQNIKWLNTTTTEYTHTKMQRSLNTNETEWKRGKMQKSV